MKPRLLETALLILFMAIGAVAGHYQGLAYGYSIILGDMQQRVEMGKK